jgi:plastocyanin
MRQASKALMVARPGRVALIIVVLCGLSLVGVMPGIAATPARAAQTHTVNIVDFSFEPGQLTIAVGDTVTWTNEDGAAHTATATGGAFDSGNMEQGDAFSFTFASAGDYPYLCTYHPEMTGTIFVRAAAPSPSESTTPSTAMPNADPGGRQLAGLMGLILVVLSLFALGLRLHRPAGRD